MCSYDLNKVTCYFESMMTSEAITYEVRLLCVCERHLGGAIPSVDIQYILYLTFRNQYRKV